MNKNYPQQYELRIEELEKRYALNASPVLNTDIDIAPIRVAFGQQSPVTGQLKNATPIKSLINSDTLKNFSDSDNDPPGLVITETNLGNGSLWFTKDAGATWEIATPISPSNALALRSDDQTFIYIEHTSESQIDTENVITFKAWDQSGESSSPYVDLQPYRTHETEVYLSEDQVIDICASPSGQVVYGINENGVFALDRQVNSSVDDAFTLAGTAGANKVLVCSAKKMLFILFSDRIESYSIINESAPSFTWEVHRNDLDLTDWVVLLDYTNIKFHDFTLAGDNNTLVVAFWDGDHIGAIKIDIRDASVPSLSLPRAFESGDQVYSFYVEWISENCLAFHGGHYSGNANSRNIYIYDLWSGEQAALIKTIYSGYASFPSMAFSRANNLLFATTNVVNVPHNHENTLSAFDVSDPNSITLTYQIPTESTQFYGSKVGGYSLLGGSYLVSEDGSTLCVSHSTGEVSLLDISRQLDGTVVIKERGAIQMPVDSVFSISQTGDLLLTADDAGLYVADSNKHPIYVNNFEGGSRSNHLVLAAQPYLNLLNNWSLASKKDGRFWSAYSWYERDVSSPRRNIITARPNNFDAWGLWGNHASRVDMFYQNDTTIISKGYKPYQLRIDDSVVTSKYESGDFAPPADYDILSFGSDFFYFHNATRWATSEPSSTIVLSGSYGLSFWNDVSADITSPYFQAIPEAVFHSPHRTFEFNHAPERERDYYSPAINSDGTLAVAADGDHVQLFHKTAGEWSLGTSIQVPGVVRDCYLSKLKDRVFILSDQGLLIADITTPLLVGATTFVPFDAPVSFTEYGTRGLAVSPDENLVAAAWSGGWALIDTATDNHPHVTSKYNNTLHNSINTAYAEFSADGRYLALGLAPDNGGPISTGIWQVRNTNDAISEEETTVGLQVLKINPSLFSLPENSLGPLTVAELQVTPLIEENITWQLNTEENENVTQSFELIENQIIAKDSFDFEQTPTVTISVSAQLGNNFYIDEEIELNVLDVNESPAITVPPTLVILENTIGKTLQLTDIHSGDNVSQPLRVTASSDNPSLISEVFVDFTQGNTDGALTLAPNENEHGIANLVITVEDGGEDNNLYTSEDNQRFDQPLTVTILEIMSNTGEQKLAKDASDNIFVNTQPVLYEGQHLKTTIGGFHVINAMIKDGKKSLAVKRHDTINLLVTDDTWQIHGLFHSLQNESSLPLDSSAREISSALDVTVVAGAYEINGARNPTLFVRRNRTYTLNLNVPSHPFHLQTTGGGYQTENVYSSGFTGDGATSGEYQWTVSQDTPDEIFYQCEFHPVMFGKIIVVD